MSGLSGLRGFIRTKDPQPPPHPIALRPEYIADCDTLLYLTPRGNSRSDTNYTVTDEYDRVRFTVSGRRSSDRECREFRDGSGLPLFELHHKIFKKYPYVVRLPGCDDENNLLKVSPRHLSALCNVEFQNAAPARTTDVKNHQEDDADKTVKLVVHCKNAYALPNYEVMMGDRVVADFRESVVKSKTLTTLPCSHLERPYRPRPILDLRVAEGVDLSLATLIAVVAMDWIYGDK
ncbi:hypothetical protein VTN96DRAFT_21 [Rasamsonia emersonii]